jgi:MFS transporter, DHA1 family, tetracycline resistance protein
MMTRRSLAEPTPRRLDPRLLLLALTIFLDLLGFGIIIPLMPQYAESYGARPIQIGLLMSSYSLMQFLCVPIWGRLSDRFGRRPILLVSIAGSALSFTFLGLARSLAALFAARLLAGTTTANFSVAQAYVADVTAPEDRARGMGVLGAAFGLGFIVGPFVGGELFRAHLRIPGGPALPPGTAPFFFAALLSTANWILALLRLPESLPASGGPVRRHPGFFTLGRLRHALRRPQVRLLFLVFFLSTLAMSMMESTLILLGQVRLQMTPVEGGRLLGFVGVLMVLLQGGMVGRLSRRYGERRLLIAGALLMAPGLFLIAPAHSYVFLALALAPLALGSGLSHPSLGALLSRISHGDEQGGILGINQSLGSLARVIGPAVGGTLFQRLGVGWPYWAGGAVMLAATVCALLIAQPGPAAEGPTAGGSLG